jgi:methyl-accepting chemotaxis protein
MLGREGMENKSKNVKSGGSASSDSSNDGSSVCPKDCSAVEALRTKLTGLIENAAKLQNQIKENNETIKNQHKTIENMQKSVQKLVQKSK